MPLATAADVAVRLGRSLTAAETAMAEQVIAAVTGQIVDAVDRDAAWADGLDPADVPVLKALCVEKVIVVGTNPNGLAAESEALGAHSHSRTFQRSNDAGMFLTDQEQRLCRSAVYGTLTGSSTPRALEDRLTDLREGRDVDEVEV